MKRNDDEKSKLKIKNLKNFVVCFFRFLGIYIYYTEDDTASYILYVYIYKRNTKGIQQKQQK